MFVIFLSTQIQVLNLPALRSFKCDQDIQTPFYNETTSECTATCGRDGTFIVNTSGVCIEECKNYTLSVGNAILCVSCNETHPYFLPHLLECTADCYQSNPLVDTHGICQDECLGTSEIQGNVTVCKQCASNVDKQYYDPTTKECVSQCNTPFYNRNGKCLSECIGTAEQQLCTPCPNDAPFFDGSSCLEKCSETSNLVNTEMKCIDSCSGVQVSMVSINNVPTAKCIVCNDTHKYYNLQSGQCVESCMNNGTVCVDKCYGQLDETTQTCAKCQYFFDEATNKCIDSCNDKILEYNGYTLCVKQCPQLENGQTCSFCSSDKPFYDKSSAACLEECTQDQYVDEYMRCVSTIPQGQYYMPLIKELSNTKNVTYKKIVKECPLNVKTNTQECEPCTYPKPFWDTTINSCVEHCQGLKNYVDINLICLDGCAGLTSDNYELYAGYAFTTCDRKCQEAQDAPGQCQKCAETLLDNKCVENCSKGNESYIVDVNFQCLNTCQSDLFYENIVCMPKCVFFNGDGLNCLAYCPESRRVVDQFNQTICRTSDDQLCQENDNKTIFPSLSNNQSCKGLKVNNVIVQNLTSCQNYSKRGFLASQYIYEENGSCVTKCSKFLVNATLKCQETCSDYVYTENNITYCQETCELNRIEDGKTKQCVQSCTGDYPYIASHDSKLCVAKCEKNEKAVDGVCVSQNKSINAGAIAGAVIGVLLLLALIVLIVVIILWKKGKMPSKCLDKIQDSIQSRRGLNGANFLKNKTQWTI